MATIKVACPKCGQKVSGDESFYGSAVECPICSSEIYFPGQKRSEQKSEGQFMPQNMLVPVPPESRGESLFPSPPSNEGELSTPNTPSESEVAASSEETTGPHPTAEPNSASSPESARGNEDRDLPPSPIYGAISIVSAVLGVVTCLGGLLAPITIICGHTALAKARQSPVQPAPGHTLGAIGLIIGYVSLALTILFLLVLTFFGDALREAWSSIQQMLGVG